MAAVNPEILTWARETAGLTLEEAAKAIGVKVSSLQRLEEGDREPSYSQLNNMADKYRRPLLAFYLRIPPSQGDRGEDFRRAPGSKAEDFDPRLDALIRDVRARHDVVRSLLDDEEVGPIPFIGSTTIETPASDVAKNIRKTIGFDLAEFRKATDESAAFNYLRGCLEKCGIFVLLLGNLGSHHSNISSRSFRGYAIADRIAPTIVINDNDARAAWSFTALHEAAHLWLGQTGVSGSTEVTRVERFCNEVASSLLLPKVDIEELQNTNLKAFDEIVKFVSDFAPVRKVSRRMVAYQLLRLQKIDAVVYQRISDQFYNDWQRSKDRDKEKPKDKVKINPYVVLRHRLGPALVNLARRSLDRGVLSPTKASRLLGVKAVSVNAFLHPPKKGKA
jgi:Zn-dependent peptidase ImmA (M78 family)/DNA-binding XRE family transcriptional regulator